MKKIDLNIQDLKELYNKGLSCKKIGLKYSVSDTTIKKRLIQAGIEIRSLRDSHLTKKFNENFFDVIDTEEKSYFLGFLYADGNIRINKSKSGYISYIISVTQMEKEPLEKFIKAIDGVNIKITEYSIKSTSKIAYTVSLNSEILFTGLNRNGCTPNKSLTLTYPLSIPADLVNHFVRGYFDGDGSVFITKKKC